MENDTNYIRPYGDTMDDGIIQLSFTLPVESGARAGKAAELYAARLGFDNIQVTHQTKIADNYTFFVIYAKGVPTIDFSKVRAADVKVKKMGFDEINHFIQTKIKRRVAVVGATIGSDAHTVGIDAIMNMKGYNHDYGLERYPGINACNMGAQVTCESLVEKALAMKADAILVSQTVTQKENHIRNFTELIELLEAENIRHKFILLAGGPRINHELAIELGYDAGFGSGTLPSLVASYIVSELIKRNS